MGHTARRISMAARELRHARRSSQPLLKRGRCPGAQPHSRTNGGAIANRFVHRRPTAGMCATSQVEDHACNGRRRRHRSDSHPSLEGGRAPGGLPQSLAKAGGFCGQSPLQAAETTCARNSGNGFSARRARHSSAEPLEPRAARTTLVARSAVGALELLAPQAEIPGILGYIP